MEILIEFLWDFCLDDGNFYENFDENLIGIFDDGFNDCLSFIQEFGTDCFCLVCRFFYPSLSKNKAKNDQEECLCQTQTACDRQRLFLTK